MQIPMIVLNWGAIAVAALSAFFVGFIWYTPLFGRTWAKLEGLRLDRKPKPGEMLKNMAIDILGQVLMAYVLAHTVQVWRPSVWNAGDDSAHGMTTAMYGILAAFFTWIGFYVPLQARRCTWGGKPWKLFLINTGYDLTALLVAGQILARWTF